MAEYIPLEQDAWAGEQPVTEGQQFDRLRGVPHMETSHSMMPVIKKQVRVQIQALSLLPG